MFYHSLNLIVILISFQLICFAQNDLKTDVAKQVKLIKEISGSSSMRFGELPFAPEINFLPKDNPIRALIDYKMPAVPFLAPYLFDTSPTKAFRVHGSGWKKQATVDEYIRLIIEKITDHVFEEKYQDNKLDISDFERQVLSWWKMNHTKNLLERKLEEVNDPIHTNRFSAYEFLGKNKRAQRGRKLLEKRIEILLASEVDTLKQSEMASCAENLAKIGNPGSAKFVRKVNEHLSYWIKNYDASYVLSNQIRTFHALALLGFKAEAITGLKELQTQYFDKMDAFTQKSFSHILKEIEDLK